MVMHNMCFISTNKQQYVIIGMLISNYLLVRIGPYTNMFPIIQYNTENIYLFY